MIKDRNTLEYIFNLVKQVKKPLVKIYPNGTIIGTDEQFASLNVLIPEMVNYDIDNSYVFRTTEITSFMRVLVNEDRPLIYSPYEIIMKPTDRKSYEYLLLTNHLEMSLQLDELYNKVMETKRCNILYQEENFQNMVPEMFSLKASDGGKMYSFGMDKKFLMTSFNAIHPANKSDKVDLIVRDLDIYSYIAEFIIYKKKDCYHLHEFLRFRKL